MLLDMRIQTLKTDGWRVPLCCLVVKHLPGCQMSSFVRTVFMLVCSATLVACSTTPTTPPPTPVEPTVAPLEQFMSEAAKSRQEGARTSERETYRKAAQAYPTSKEPWLKLAEGYFESGDYGNTVLAAQEVLQRDASDRVATSLLAVSGLRVATTALASLRQSQDQEINADTRRQAADLVKSIREALGEPVLVPKPVEPATTTPRRSAAPKRLVPVPAPGAGPTPAVGSAATAAPKGASTAPVKPASAPVVAPLPAKKPTNPFDKLN
ncbi:hypothetical protein ACG0Z6_02455 [Roseateles sp. BYS180W]|uniref:Tetratricopeptide repeat protein n=1 Tax=Roseateles rivi TaxID=3299028 RepID=A0ABW7FS71_9BURK